MSYIETSGGAPTKSWLKAWLHYDPETGIFTWLKGANTGREAGNLDRYRTIQIGGHRFRASKLAWLYMTGEYPEGIIDHKNRIIGNDSWENLRKATTSQNEANKGPRNALGVKGVKREGNKFCAEIRINGHKKYLGLFNTLEEAGAAYTAAAKELYGEFAL